MSKIPRFSWRNLTPQLVAIVILPLAVFTLVIVLGGLLLHQDSMRTMVGERDERSVRAAAAALAQELTRRADMINLLLELADVQEVSSPFPSPVLQTGLPAEDFNRGVALLDGQGQLLWYTGERQVWENLALQAPGRLQGADPAGQPVEFQVSQSSAMDEWIFFVFSAPNQEGARLVGGHSLNDLIDQALREVVGSPGSGMAFVINSHGEILYTSGEASSPNLSEHPGVSQALDGKSGSTLYVAGGDEYVVAYSPVTPYNFAIVVEEPWEEVANPLLRRTEFAPLIVVPIFLLSLLAIWFGTRYVVQPLQRLETRASALAWGDYETIEQPVGGIAEIQHLHSALVHLAHKVRTAQQGLRSYIGAITMGQEDERRRLARELHDDTLQALIALNQRIQLAELHADHDDHPHEYMDIRALLDDTIQNLRRITRALRPIYLEDLGLSAALEMLVREIEAAGDIVIEFKKTGTERRLPGSIELALYRIVQEALNNVVRHASATHASLHLSFGDDEVSLEVSDNGGGFDVPESPAEMVPQGHYGLLGMYERAELVGASLEILSNRDAGTVVRLHLPHSSLEELPLEA